MIRGEAIPQGSRGMVERLFLCCVRPCRVGFTMILCMSFLGFALFAVANLLVSFLAHLPPLLSRLRRHWD